jgi:hypothetical protein
MWTPARRTSHSKIMGIRVGPSFADITDYTLLWEGFPIDLGTFLWGLASIQPQEH